MFFKNIPQIMYVSHWLRAETLGNSLTHQNYRPRFDLINFFTLKHQVAFKDDFLMGIA